MTKEQTKQLKPEENEVAMEELEKNARELILAITKKTLETLKDNGLLKEPSSLQNLSFSSPEMRAFLEKIKAPKYDPCRLLKKGDKVQVIARNDRCWGKTGEYLRGAYCFVLEDEERNAMVKVRHNSSEYTIDPAYLELVTPVEELEPYYIGDCADDPDCKFFYIQHNDNEISYGLLEEVARFVYDTDYTADKETVRKRAEAVRDMLNAEYRKEQNNGLGH